MVGLRSKLAKIERAALMETGGGQCTICWDEPNVLLVVHKLVRSGSKTIGIRKTGEIYIAEERVGRITEDLHDMRCVGCRTEARKALVMYTPGIGPERHGKKLPA